MAPSDDKLMDTVSTLTYADKLLTATKPKGQLQVESIYRSAELAEQIEEKEQPDIEKLV